MGPGREILGENACFRPDLRQILGDGEGVPDLDAVVDEAGTRKDGDSRSNTARVDGSSEDMTSS